MADLSHLDEEQVRLMTADECILVDGDDKVIGHDSKKACHLMTNINNGLLHRAFSVFLFDTKGRLLLQQRAAEKITFPLFVTNTCCSHPLHTPLELEEENQIGVKRAAQRKLKHELGIEPDEIPLEDFHFLTRIHYKSGYDEIWGEHEVDYVLVIQRDVAMNPNLNEVTKDGNVYLSKPELEQLIAKVEAQEASSTPVEGEEKVLLTPWFRLIVKNFLYKWWDTLLEHTNSNTNNANSSLAEKLAKHVDMKIILEQLEQENGIFPLIYPESTYVRIRHTHVIANRLERGPKKHSLTISYCHPLEGVLWDCKGGDAVSKLSPGIAVGLTTAIAFLNT